jgi:hypothetical protein
MWFIVPAVLILLYVFKASGRKQFASVRGTALVFGPSRQVVLIIAGSFVLGAALILGPILQTGTVDGVTTIIGSLAILAGGAVIPALIVLSGGKVESNLGGARASCCRGPR